MTLLNIQKTTLPSGCSEAGGISDIDISKEQYSVLGQKAAEQADNSEDVVLINSFKNEEEEQQPQQVDQNKEEIKIFKPEDLYNISKEDKTKDLKNRYTSTKRSVEIVSVTLFSIFLGISTYNLISWSFVKNIWVFLSSSVLAMFMADFFSGIVHWAADTWGTLDTPIVGNSFIRSFREHHVAPVAMTHHDVIETNGDNCMLTVPILAITAFADIKTDTTYNMFLMSFLVNLCFWVSLTNQIHKWSHTHKVHPFVGFLQKSGIILSKRDHAVHHRNPFDKFYCITNGWLNPWLASINFWKRLENVITLLTGAIPRADDQAWTS